MTRKWTTIFLVLTGSLIGLLFLVAVFINTAIGHRTVAALVAPLSGGMVSVQGLSGQFPYSLRAQRVELRDDGGAWLVIEDAIIDWSPFALLWNRADVSRFEARHVQVLRLPLEDDEPSDTGFAVDARELKIDLLETTAEVSKTPARVALQGAVRYDSLDAWRADLVANRLDANGLYRARASLAGGVLTGSADIEEPSAGLVAGLLGFNDVGALEIHVTGSGPRNANAIALRVAAGPLRAAGQGLIDLTARTAQLDFSAEAPEMALRPDLAWQSFSAEGQLRGAFDAPDANANLNIRSLRVQDVSMQRVTASVTGSSGTVDFSASLAGLRLPGAEPDIFARAPVSARGTIELRTPALPFTGSLTHALLTVEANGTAGDTKHAQANISVPRLAPFAARRDIDLDGRATLTATIDQAGDEFRIAATGAINATGGEGPLPRLIGANARVVLNATANGPDIAISDARLEGAAAKAQLSGSLSENDIGVNWTLNLEDLSLITASLVGDLRAQGRLRGPWQTARLDASAVGNIGTPRIARQPINVAVNAVGFPRSQSGNFSAQGRFDNAPLSLDGQLLRVQDGLKATVERGAWKSLIARADVTIPENGDIDGTATLSLGRLNDIASVIGEPIEGDVQADVVFRRRNGETAADITARAQAVRYEDVAVRDIEAKVDLAVGNDRSAATIEARAGEFALPDVSVRNATLSGRIDQPFDTPSLALAVNAPGLTAAQFTGGAKAQIDGRTDAMRIRFEWAPRDDAGNAGQISATTRVDLPRRQVLFSALQAKYRDETVILEQPFTLAFGPETTIDGARLKLADGQVFIAGSIAPRLALRATAENVSPALLGPFVPELSNEGMFSATGELSGTLADPEGTIVVQGRGLRARGYSAGVMPASLDARAVLRGRSAAINAEIGSGATLKLLVTGNVSLEGEYALDLDVQGQSELSIFNPMLSAEGRSVQGQMTLALSVAGTASAPQLSGRATLAKGEFQDVQRGLRVRDISLTAEGAGERIRIVELSGRAGDGTITGTGTIDLSKTDIPVSFTITAQNARPLVSDRLAATTDANLRITGAVRGQLLVAGTIDVTQGQITLPESVPPSIAVLAVRRPGAASMPVAAEMASTFADIRYDLTIATRGRVFVRGRGLEAELEGTTTIRGSAAGAPQISGGFELRRGTFTVASRTFVLTTGRVTFDGVSIRNRIDPTLDFAAENTSSGITAKIAITGYASAPRIELSSTPTMPPDEILARMLFQRSAAELTPLQLAQLAETAVALASGGSGFDPLGSLRRSLGLSRLSVGSTGETMSGTTVEAGTYVLRNVYVGAKQGLEGGTQAEVQVELTDRLKVVGTVNAGANAAVTQGSKQQETGSSIGLSYEFEY